jgi:DNA-binding transcriptional ArsR family regulator
MSTGRVLKALAEPRRQQILRVLKDEGEMSATDLGRRVEVTQQAASLHLKALEEAGLVSARREGTRQLYAVRPEGFRPAIDFVAEFWEVRLADLRNELDSS